MATLVGCLCLLALLSMLAAQQHRENRETEQHLFAVQQELAHQQARNQDLQRQLRSCRAKKRASTVLTPVANGLPRTSNASLEPASESLLAAAELVQAELHAGLAAETPGWCVCPPKPNYTRVCSALLPPPADNETATARREAEQQSAEAERLRRLLAREKLHLLRSNEQLALAQAEASALDGACAGGRGRRGGAAGGRARGHAAAAGGGRAAVACEAPRPTPELCQPLIRSAQAMLADALAEKVAGLKAEAAANATRLEVLAREAERRCAAAVAAPAVATATATGAAPALAAAAATTAAAGAAATVAPGGAAPPPAAVTAAIAAPASRTALETKPSTAGAFTSN